MTATDLSANDIVWDLSPLLPAPDDSGSSSCSPTPTPPPTARRLSRPRCDARRRRPRRVHARPRRGARPHRPGRQLRRPRLRGRHDRSRTRRAHAEGRRAQHGDQHQAACSSSSNGPSSPTSRSRRCSPTRVSSSPRITCARRAGTGRICSPSRKRSCSPRSRSPAASAWERLFDEQVSAITVELDGETDDARSRPRAPARTRPRGAPSRGRGGRPRVAARPAHARVRAQHAARRQVDRRPACATSARWIASRNLANEASDESVQALVEAVQGRYAIPQRWYTLKAQLLGIDQLADYDRMASVGGVESEVGLGRGEGARARRVRVVLAASSPTPRSEFFDNPGSTRRRGRASDRARSARTRCRRIIRTCCSTGRRAAATCSRSRTSSGTACTRTSPAGRACSTRRRRSRSRRPRRCSARPSRSAGCSRPSTDPAERLTLLAANLEDQIATVFRQIAMNRFEHAMHTARREEGELSVERLGELWYDSQHAMLGDSVEVTDGYRTWWSYIPHFIGTPGYVYAYAYGQLLALSVYARLRGGRDRLRAAATSTCSRAGGSKSPQELGEMVGVDLADPGFWDRGLDIIERRLDADDRSRDRGRETLVTYRVIQWSTGNVGQHALRLHRRASRSRARRAVGAQRRQGRPRRGRARRHRPDRRASRPTTSTRCSRSTPTASVTPRPPTCVPAKRSPTWRASSRRARTSCRARSCRSSTRRTSPASMRKPLEDACIEAATCRASRRASIPGWANDLLPLVLTGTCEYIDDGARDGGRQLRDLRAADGAVRHDGLRPGARRDAAAPHPRRAVVRVGWRR